MGNMGSGPITEELGVRHLALDTDDLKLESFNRIGERDARVPFRSPPAALQCAGELATEIVTLWRCLRIYNVIARPF